MLEGRGKKDSHDILHQQIESDDLNRARSERLQRMSTMSHNLREALAISRGTTHSQGRFTLKS